MAMRTSGVQSDPIYYIPVLVAIVAVVLLFGGPASVFGALEQLLRSVISQLASWIQALAG